MFTSMKIQALAQKAPENTRSPGWWPHLRYLRIRQGSSWPSLATVSVLSVIHGLSSAMALAGFTWVLYLFFLLYIMHRIESLG